MGGSTRPRRRIELEKEAGAGPECPATVHPVRGAVLAVDLSVSSHEPDGGSPLRDRRVIARPSTAAPVGEPLTSANTHLQFLWLNYTSGHESVGQTSPRSGLRFRDKEV